MNLSLIHISSPTELVTLKEEIEHLKEYITLQQYRFHYAVKINVMVSQDLYEFLSLKLMFQPLVENALNHGFEGFTGNERIGIFGYQKEGILYFQVTDNGVGMAPEQVEALNGYILSLIHILSFSPDGGGLPAYR